VFDKGIKNDLNANVRTNKQLNKPEAMVITSEQAKILDCLVHKGVSVTYINSLHSTTLFVCIINVCNGGKRLAWYLSVPWDAGMCN
jgi:hypothetical protein